MDKSSHKPINVQNDQNSQTIGTNPQGVTGGSPDSLGSVNADESRVYPDDLSSRPQTAAPDSQNPATDAAFNKTMDAFQSGEDLNAEQRDVADALDELIQEEADIDGGRGLPDADDAATPEPGVPAQNTEGQTPEEAPHQDQDFDGENINPKQR